MAVSSSHEGLLSGPVPARAPVRLAPLGAALLGLLISSCEHKSKPGRAGTPHRDTPEYVTTKTGIEMVLVPPGEFVMGDDGGEDDERPVHTVRVGAFYMDRHEVTQKSYESLMGRNPSKSKGPGKPVERLSWYAAIKYCNMRSLREGLKPCYDPETLECDSGSGGYRLPTEAEWEYACRAGTETEYSFGSDPRKLARYAWFKRNAGKTTRPAGQKEPNAWGLYDMHGNVSEWCNDFYGEGHYQESAGGDPRGPDSGDERVLRGGNWRSSPESCRSSARYSEPPGFADVCFGYDAYGFRCVRSPPAASHDVGQHLKVPTLRGRASGGDDSAGPRLRR